MAPDSDLLTSLTSQLTSSNEKRQLQALSEITALMPDAGATVLELLQTNANWAWGIKGRAYEVLLELGDHELKSQLESRYPQGIVPLVSDQGLDYQPLQQRLVNHDYQAADDLTLKLLCQLAGAAATKRGWLYFTEVEQFPITDLLTIDHLWLAHSEGKFGYSVQRQIWLGLGQNWEQLWAKINWRQGKKWTRWPSEFTWDLSAPRGHLPLSNQLRGIQVINALLNHPAWSTQSS